VGKTKKKPIPRQFADFEALIKKLVTQTEGAIRLHRLCKRLNEDPRIDSAYNNTYEAHGFVLAKSAVEYSLVLSVTRMHDKDQRTASLRRFFYDFEHNREPVRAGVLEQRIKWVPLEEALNDTDERMTALDKAAADHQALLDTNEWELVENLRHTVIAHSDFEPEKIEMPQYDYLYLVCDKTVAIVDALSSNALGVGEGFKAYAHIWDAYALKFFESMLAWRGPVAPLSNDPAMLDLDAD
jgi:hypothetical protein